MKTTEIKLQKMIKEEIENWLQQQPKVSKKEWIADHLVDVFMNTLKSQMDDLDIDQRTQHDVVFDIEEDLMDIANKAVAIIFRAVEFAGVEGETPEQKFDNKMSEKD